MRNPLLIFAFATLTGTSSIASPGTQPRLLADDLAAQLSRTDEQASTVLQKRFATGYIAGVADSTRGKAWCDPGNVKPDEIDAYLLFEIKKMPYNTAHANAATVIAELLKKRFPCPGK